LTRTVSFAAQYRVGAFALGISRYQLPAVHPEEEGKGHDEAESVEVATKGKDPGGDLAALSTPFDSGVESELDAGWSVPPEAPDHARPAADLLRLDAPDADVHGQAPTAPPPAPPAVSDAEDDFSDFDDPSVPPAPAAPKSAPAILGRLVPKAPAPTISQKPAPVLASVAPATASLHPPAGEVHLSPKAIVVVAIGPDKLRELPLDPRIMFLLTHLDGVTDLDTVLEMCGIPADTALDALDALAQQGVIVRIS
jgi:hypothetical protein